MKKCRTCKYKRTLVKWDYSKGGCTHSICEGYVCTALSHDDVVIHMTGNDPGRDWCEMYTEDVVCKTFREWEADEARTLNVGDRIAEALKRRGMSQKELAQITKSTDAAVSRYVNNQRMPNASMILKIAEALNVSTDYLLGLEA